MVLALLWLRPSHHRLVHRDRPTRGNLVVAPAPSRPLAHRPNRILAAIPVIPLIIVAIATAVGTLATTGRLMRWLPETGPRRAGGTLATTGRLMRWLPETGPRRALAATLAIAMLSMIIDVTMITLVMVSGAPSRPLLIITFCRQPHSHCLQHHDRATRQPDASLMIEVDHGVQR